MSNRLFVGSLPWSVTSEDLKNLFSLMGKVTDAVVITDKASGKSQGYGFIEMASVAEAKAAQEKYDGYEIRGRKIVVNSAEPKQTKTLFM